jgi:hypothetical protein
MGEDRQTLGANQLRHPADIRADHDQLNRTEVTLEISSQAQAGGGTTTTGRFDGSGTDVTDS